MSPDELDKLISADRDIYLEVSPELFSELEKKLRKRRYTYRPATARLSIKMATPMHGAVADFAALFKESVMETGAIDRRDLVILSELKITGLAGDYAGIIKVPDIALWPRGRPSRPTITFEFGYTENNEGLRDDTKTLLEGTLGEIIKVIVIKVEPLHPGETHIRSGFVEVFKFLDGKAREDGGRKILYPPPISRHTQQITLTLGEILGDECGNLANEGWTKDDEIHIPLEPLREAIDSAIEFYQS